MAKDGGALSCVCCDGWVLPPPQAESIAAALRTSVALNFLGLKSVMVMMLVVNTEQAL